MIFVKLRNKLLNLQNKKRSCSSNSIEWKVLKKTVRFLKSFSHFLKLLFLQLNMEK